MATNRSRNDEKMKVELLDGESRPPATHRSMLSAEEYRERKRRALEALFCLSAGAFILFCVTIASCMAAGSLKLSCVASLGYYCSHDGRAGRAGLLSSPPSELPYYGLSPPVYPSPPGNGSSSAAWSRAYTKAHALVDQMTLQEKLNLTYGFPGPCAGNSGTVSRLGVPALCFADAPDGVRGQEFVSAFPAGIHLAATFDQDLMYRYGLALGREYYGRGIHVALGPVAGPLGRIARGGRNWEGLSNDPYLAGIALGALTRGLQDAGVVATPKHFLFNEQEYRRRDAPRQPADNVVGEGVSANVDDRTLHELYAFPFMDALRAGTASVMCSYQRANHSYGCQNAKLLNGILKTELGFEGFVISDWDAQHSGVGAALAGLDVAMPNSDGFWAGGLLEQAVKNGSVPEARINDMATRLLAGWFAVTEKMDNATAVFPSPPAVYPATEVHPVVDVQADHARLIRTIGSAGTVLVKNVNGTLPLRRPRFLAVYGYDAILKASPWDDADRFGGGYSVNRGWNTLNGTLIVAGGSGGTTPPYVVSPFQALQERVVQARGVLRWDFWSEKPPTAYANAEACLVFINAYASESYDRPSLTDTFSDNLVRNVANMCSNTIVVIHSAGIRVVDAWIDHPNVTAVVFAGLPGQESGHSLVDVLYGNVNPSGRLPYTVAQRESDYGRILNSTFSTDYFPEDNFDEGLFLDYRAFDRQGLTPRFPFGHGLSYTTFKYGARVDAVVTTEASTAEFPDPELPIVQGGHPQLWETIATVPIEVTNTGAMTGSEVAQLYVGVPGADENPEVRGDTPARQLRGFQRIGPLMPGQAAKVQFPLTRRDLSVWDVTAQQWRLRRGSYQLYIGPSSRDLQLRGELTIR